MNKLLVVFVVLHPVPLLANGLIERLEHLESRPALLERQIIASPIACDTLSPSWTQLKGAAGRFLMGDDSDPDFGETGGATSIALFLDKLAPHSHEMTNLRRASDEAGEAADGFTPGSAFNGGGGGPGRILVFGAPVNQKVHTQPQGATTPFSTLAPFLEIYFWTKTE